MDIQGSIANLKEFYPGHAEMLIEIFSYLSPKDLVNSALVCKLFNKIAQSGCLRNRSLDQYYQNPNSFSTRHTQSSSQVNRLYHITHSSSGSDEDICDKDFILDRNEPYGNEFNDSDDEGITEIRIPSLPLKEEMNDVTPIQKAIIDQDLDQLRYLVAEGFKADFVSLKIAVLKKAPLEIILLLKEAGAKVDERIIRHALENEVDNNLLKVLLEGEYVSLSLINYALDIGVRESILNLLMQYIDE